MSQIVDWLLKQHQQIMDCEQTALDMLAKDDIAGYREKMREKAELLASLAERARPELEGLPETSRRTVEAGLQQFSASAETALSLDSLFYKSALLYRDDHKRGEPDNLEIFIQAIRQKLA